MDLNSLIITALTIGVISGIEKTTSQAMKDAYKKLISLIRKKLTKNKAETKALNEFLKNPKTGSKRLKEQLIKYNFKSDTEILNISQTIVDLYENHQPKIEFNNEFSGKVQGVVQNNPGTINMHFKD